MTSLLPRSSGCSGGEYRVYKCNDTMSLSSTALPSTALMFGAAFLATTRIVLTYIHVNQPFQFLLLRFGKEQAFHDFRGLLLPFLQGTFGCTLLE
mmetsp:Transcript_9261/g.25627  ORF Transcript_9261/g.25627 Transcript_9261/m.25627 type:complete len:95 (+) Transcript_9261:123-407(+)